MTENLKKDWLRSLSENEKFLAERGLFFEGNQTHLSSVKITGKNGDNIDIEVETILIGGNSLAVPSTREAQKEFGASIYRHKKPY